MAKLCDCGCGNVVKDGQRFFRMHNSRWKGYRDLVGRLFAKRRIVGECWIWTGTFDTKGYGQMSFNGRKTYVYRLAYEHFVGPIPEGLEPDHLCKTPACFNPKHIEPVPQAENARRGRQSKLTHVDVAVIRELKEPHTETALRYGVHPSTICDIRNFRRWNYEGRSS